MVRFVPKHLWVLNIEVQLLMPERETDERDRDRLVRAYPCVCV